MKRPSETGRERFNDHAGCEDVLICRRGARPGLMLAGELALAGVDVAIVERRATQALVGLRAGGLHARTIEVLDQRGIADRFLAEGQVAQVGLFAGVRFDISELPTRHPYSLGLWQNHIERILAGWVDELERDDHRGREVTGFAQDETGVDVALSGGRRCGRSILSGATADEPGPQGRRHRVPGVGSDSQQPDRRGRTRRRAGRGIRHDAIGIHALGRMEYKICDGEIVYADSGPVRVMVTEARSDPPANPRCAISARR